MANRLSKVGERFKSRFKLIDGREFFGQLLGLPDTSRVSNFLSARRYLRTNVGTFIVPGLVMVANGTHFIIAEHGEGFYNEPIYHHFKLFDVDSIEPWYPVVSSTDAVTGVKTLAPSPTSSQNAYLSTQPAPYKVDAVNVPQQFKTAVCDKAVGVGDQVGDHIVTKSDFVLGVYFLEMKKL